MINPMKAIIAAILAIMMVGCGTAKKAVQKSANDSIAMQVQSKTDSIGVQKVVTDTTKTAEGTTIITEIVFQDVADTSKSEPPDVIIDDHGGIHVQGGNVKSIRQYKNERKTEIVGKSESETSVNVEKAYTVAIERKTESVAQEQPIQSEPYKWRYIWRILATIVAVAIVVLLLIFRRKICGWLMNFIGGFARMFK